MTKSSNRRATHGLARILDDDDVTSFEDVAEALRKKREDDDTEATE